MKTMNKAFLILAASMTAFVAYPYEVYRAYLNTLYLDTNPQVVTNVTFDGIPQPSDITTNDVYAIVTNMTALTPVYGGNGEPFSEWAYHNLPDGSEFYNDSGISFSDGTWVLQLYIGYFPYTGRVSGTAADTELEFSRVIAEDEENQPEYSITATRTENQIIGYTLGSQTNSVLAATNGIVTAETATNIASSVSTSYIATNNPAFVAAVTNCPVVIASSDAEALTQWGIYGGGGTIGAIIAALVAAVASLKRQQRYSIVEPTVSVSSGAASVELQDRAINTVSLASDVTQCTFTFPQKDTGKARDFFVRLTITGSDVPTIYFKEQGGASVAFDVDDDSWAEIEQGVNVLMFSDTSEESVA